MSSSSKRNIPRPLTEEEIEDILSGIDKITYAVKSATELAQNEVKNLLRSQLQSIELVPAAIPEMKKTIRNQYNRSVIEPQTPVGFLVSEALSQPIMQMTMNSVVSETQIVVCDKVNGAQVVEIGKWIDSLLLKNQEKVQMLPENRTEFLLLDHPVLIPSTTSDGKTTEWMELTAVTRHLPVGDLVKIKTRSGKEVIATSQKSFLVYDPVQDKLMEKDGARLQVGDKVGIQKEIGLTKICSNLDLVKYLPKTEFIYGSEIKKFKMLYEKDKNGRQVPANWWSEHRNVSFTIPLGRNDSIVKSIQYNDFEDGMVYPKMSNLVKNKIPENIPLDREFGYILGLYLAEGHANKTTVIFSNNAPEILEPVEKWCKNYNLGYHIQVQTHKNFENSTSTDLRIHSTLLASLFTRMMGTGSPNKRIPDEALKAPEDFIIGLIDGYTSGDGCVAKNDGSIVVSSVSENLIWGISYLLSRLGITSKKSGSQAKKNNIGSKVILYSHTLSIRNHNKKIFADKIKLTCNKKQERLENITKNNEQKCIRTKNYYQDWNNIVLDSIVSVESISSKTDPSDENSPLKFVYDVTVPKSLNFNLFNGLVMLD
jgi:intein/homing endonuclease